MPAPPISRPRKIILLLFACLFAGSGVLHFTATKMFEKIVPPYLPAHRPLVLLSGAAEIAGAFGLLIPSFRRRAAWALVALLLAVFPANIYMAMDNIQVTRTPAPPALLWARLPLQFVLIGLLVWCSAPPSRRLN